MSDSILKWAYDFYLNTTVNGQLVSAKTAEYDVYSSMTSLKFLLQDIGISHIPPGCKLPHQHYFNPLIHDVSDKLYLVVDKLTHNKHYIEVYVRQDHTGFLVGYEAVNVNDNLDRISREFNLFELVPNSSLHTKAINGLSSIGIVDLSNAKIKYEQNRKAIDELISSLG